MCGIAGYIGKKEINEGCIQSTLHLMKNRGPDFQSHVGITTTSDNKIYLLHSRLSIIDLDPRSNQPYEIDGRYLVYNGEIYNYVEIRDELKQLGVSFHTNSDTEVLLRSFLMWGIDCTKKFEGMWSFAIYDSTKDQFYLSRDRFAEKPLYIKQTKHGVYFGSEVKFIQELSESKLEINSQQVMRYLVNGYKSLYKTNDTYFSDISEIPFSTNTTIAPDLSITNQKYWSHDFSINSKITLQDAIEGTKERLIESLKIRLRADVPLAFCLSGGIDSASLASIASKEFQYDVNTFSIIDKDERYNEYDNIKATIDDISCKHTLIHLEPTNMLERLKALISYHDGPIATISYLVHSMLSEKIAENGYKVAISGTAADELYTGYYDHFNLHLYEMRNHPEYETYLNDWKSHTGNFVRNPYFKNPEMYFDDPSIRDHIYLNNDVFASYLKRDFSEQFTEQHYNDGLLHNRMLNELFHEGSRVILHEDDLNSMKYSIENRSPFLDSKLCEFAYSIPLQYLIKDGYGKFVLRESMNGILNDQVRLDRKKKGFNAAITSIVDFKDKKQREYILEDSPVYNLVDKSKIENILNQDVLENSFSKFFFNFLNVKIFLEQNEL